MVISDETTGFVRRRSNPRMAGVRMNRDQTSLQYSERTFESDLPCRD
ncbi:hypothetical protein ACVMAJ_000606 [Bradyrhizobium sp. USDA 4448]